MSDYELQQLAGLASGGLVLLCIVLYVVKWGRAIDAIFPDAARMYGLSYARRSVGSYFTGRGEHLTLQGEIQGSNIRVLAHRERTGRYRMCGTIITAEVRSAVAPFTVTVSQARPLHPMHLVPTGDASFDTRRFMTCDAPDTMRAVLTPSVLAALLKCPQDELRLKIADEQVALSWTTLPTTAHELHAAIDVVLALASASRPARPRPGTSPAPTTALDDGDAVLAHAFGFSPEHREANRLGKLHPEQRTTLARRGGAEAFVFLLSSAFFACAGVAGGVYNVHDRMDPSLATFAIPAGLGLALAGACCVGLVRVLGERRARLDALVTGAPNSLEGPVAPWEIHGHGVPSRIGFTIRGQRFNSTRTWNALLTPGAHYKVYFVHDVVLGVERSRARDADG